MYKYLKYLSKNMRQGGGGEFEQKQIDEIESDINEHVWLVTGQDGFYIHNDDAGNFYLSYNKHPVGNFEPFDHEYPTIHSSWGTLVYGHDGGNWDHNKLILIIPFSELKQLNILKINPEDTMLLTDKIPITPNTWLVVGQTIYDHHDSYTNMEEFLQYFKQKQMLKVFNDSIIEYDIHNHNQRDIYDQYLKKCTEYNIKTSTNIEYYINDMYYQLKFLLDNKISKTYDEKYYKTLTYEISKTIITKYIKFDINLYCFFKIFQRECARDAVDLVIKHIAISQNKKIYRLIYCNQTDKQNQFALTRCVRIIDSTSQDNLKNDVMSDFNVDNKFSIPKDITEYENIFGQHSNTFTYIYTKLLDNSENGSIQPDHFFYFLDDFVEAIIKYNNRKIFIRQKFSNIDIINQTYSAAKKIITKYNSNDKLESKLKKLTEWKESYCLNCLTKNYGLYKYCDNCKTLNINYKETCTKCGQDVLGKKYCDNCKTLNINYVETCTQCGANVLGKEYCSMCGTKNFQFTQIPQSLVD